MRLQHLAESQSENPRLLSLCTVTLSKNDAKDTKRKITTAVFITTQSVTVTVTQAPEEGSWRCAWRALCGERHRVLVINRKAGRRVVRTTKGKEEDSRREMPQKCIQSEGDAS